MTENQEPMHAKTYEDVLYNVSNFIESASKISDVI